MADKWKSIFKGSIENRYVEIEIYDEGGYRIHTTQGANETGEVQIDGASTIIISPTEQGRKITIESENLEEIRNDLLVEGFSEFAANKVLSKIPA